MIQVVVYPGPLARWQQVCAWIALGSFVAYVVLLLVWHESPGWISVAFAATASGNVVLLRGHYRSLARRRDAEQAVQPFSNRSGVE